MPNRLPRVEVPREEAWDLHSLYADVAEWEADFAAVEAALPGLEAFRGRLAEGAAPLLAFLTARDQVLERALRVSAYASLRRSADATDPEAQAMASRSGALHARLAAASAFLAPELLALPEDTVAGYLDAEPGLAPYAHALDEVLSRREHTLTAEGEAVLAALGDALATPVAVYNAATGADMRFPNVADDAGDPVAMSVAAYERLVQSPDREVRREAHAALHQGLRAYQTTLASSLASSIRARVTVARLRGYGSALEATLAPHRIPLSVHEQILDVIQAELAPHVRRYNRLRSRVLGIDQLTRYDLTAPLEPGYDPQVSFAEAGRMIQEGLAVLGPEYGEMLGHALHERWVDRADNAGKTHGAFCQPIYGYHPVVLMTWQGMMRDVFVLVHELGHAGHFYLAAEHQPLVTSGCGAFYRFMVEAPSTCNEVLLGLGLLDQEQDVRKRRHILVQFMGTFLHNFVTHLLEAELERRLYRLAEAGRPLTVGAICENQLEVFENFYAGTVQIQEEDSLNWMRVPHLYVGFYPYTYAAGLSAACAVAQAIRSEGTPAVERWLGMLKAGMSKYPLELLQMAGVDMTGPEPVRSAIALFGRLVDELEQCC